MHNNPPSSEAVKTLVEQINTLVDKVKRLEDAFQIERRGREHALQQERSLWEREVRILREALAPFYQSEKEMRRRLLEIEDKVEGNYDEHVRLRDRVVAVDDASMSIEKRVEELEGLRSKRRRVVRNHFHDSNPQTDYMSSADDNFRRVSSSNDGGSVRTPSSRALSPSGIAGPPAVTAQGARSSGILNLVAEAPRPPPFTTLAQRLSQPQDEVRSSGFLRLDLDERLKEKTSGQKIQTTHPQAARYTPPHDRLSPASTSEHSPLDGPPATRRTPQPSHNKMPLIDIMLLPESLSPRKRKHHLDHIALDVLADVTVASPLIH